MDNWRHDDEFSVLQSFASTSLFTFSNLELSVLVGIGNANNKIESL